MLNKNIIPCMHSRISDDSQPTLGSIQGANIPGHKLDYCFSSSQEQTRHCQTEECSCLKHFEPS